MKLRVAYVGDSHGFLNGDPITKLGSVARAATAFDVLSAQHPDTLKFHGGDILGSSPFTIYFKGMADLAAFKKMNFLAFVPGNHDFHFGTAHLAQMIKTAEKPFLAANIDATEDPHLKNLIIPFFIYQTEKAKIAVIGLTTEELNKLGEHKTGKVKILDLKKSVDLAVQQAQHEGATVYIILSHMGYAADKELAEKHLQNKNMSFVILGNHSHTTCGKSLPKVSFGESRGDYPTVIDLGNKHKALITTVPHNLQVVSCLKIEYDNENHIVNHSKDSTVMLDEKFKEDPEVKEIVATFEKQLPATLTKVYAQAKLAYSGLDGQPPFAKCIEDFIRQTESPIGNLAADAFHWQAKELDSKVDFALIHAGGIRTDWSEGPITGWDIHQLHPFEAHNIITLDLTGEELRQALEESVCNDNFHRRSEFLIGSKALSYQYNITSAPNSRISVVNFNGVALDPTKIYRVAINGFIANANNFYGKPNIINQRLAQYKEQGDTLKYREFKVIDREALINYFEHNPPARELTGKLDGRIVYQGISLLDEFASKGTSVENKYISCMNNLKYAAYVTKPSQEAREQPTLQAQQNP